jgi:hypothetical protein
MDPQARADAKAAEKSAKEAAMKVKQEMKREEKVAEALDVERQVGKIAFQERVKEVKNQARERLNKYKAIEQKNLKASEPPDERPPQLNPAREMKPLPINYIPYKRIQEIRSGENSRAYLGTSAMSLRKPLAPNVLDIAAMEREKELAAQRRQAGHKWVQVMPR